MAWWRYSKAEKAPTPGAGIYALTSNYQVPRPMIGSGIAYLEERRAFSPACVQAVMMVPTTGLGGLASGQIALQPLSDPYNAYDNAGGEVDGGY